MRNEFDGLAQIYERYRPDYPTEILKEIYNTLYKYRPNVEEDGLAIDVGSGTGISTRLLRKFLPQRIPIIGIEPGLDMLTNALKQSSAFDNICYVRSNADKTIFQNKAIDLILVAQALQWFPRKEFYQEAVRILKENGILAIIQNNRRWEQSPFLSEYEELLERYSKGYSRNYRAFNIEQELRSINELSFVSYSFTDWERHIEKEEFIGMCMSSTKYNRAQKDYGPDFINNKLSAILTKYFPNSSIVNIKYRSEVFTALKEETFK